MKDLIMRTLAGILTVGFTLWSPGAPLALALDVDAAQCRELISNDSTLDPAVRDIALREVLPKIEESAKPDASAEAVREAKIVETTAVAIHDTTESVKEALKNTDAVTKNAVEALTKSGVASDKIAGIETQMKQALTQAKDVLNNGGSMADVAKSLDAVKSVMSEQLKGDTTVNFREAFASAGGRSREVLGAALDPAQRNVMEATMKAHFEGNFKEMTMRGMGAEGKANGGASPGAIREMAVKAAAVGFDPREMMAKAIYSSRGEFAGTNSRGASRELVGPPVDANGNPVSGPTGERGGPTPEVMEKFAAAMGVTPERFAAEMKAHEGGAPTEKQMQEIAEKFGAPTEAQMKDMAEKFGGIQGGGFDRPGTGGGMDRATAERMMADHPEMAFREMPTREVFDRPVFDRTDITANRQDAASNHTCPVGQHQVGDGCANNPPEPPAHIFHDHNHDGHNEHDHIDTNRNGIVDPGEPTVVSGL